MLTVPAIVHVATRMESAGIESIRPKIIVADGSRQIRVEDPDGQRMELMRLDVDCVRLQTVAPVRLRH